MSGLAFVPSMDSLLRMSYRELQQVAKPLGVPCNIKKAFLQEVLYQSFHGTPTQVALVVEQAMQERRANTKKREPRKKYERRKEVQRKITGPKEKWDSLMAANCQTPTRTIKQRSMLKPDGEVDSRPFRLINANRNMGMKRRQPILYSNIRKYAKKPGESDVIPCDRILRSNVFPICDRLDRRKYSQRTGENHVSSTQDCVDSRAVLDQFDGNPAVCGTDLVSSVKLQPDQAVDIIHEYNEPIDFSFKKYQENYCQTNLTLQSMVQYQSINSNSHSTCLTYGTVTQTENYQHAYQPEETMSLVHNTQLTLYAEDKDNGSVVSQNRNMYSQVASSYAVDYPAQVPIHGEIHGAVNNYDQYPYYTTLSLLNSPPNCTPPYFHKKIRINRRQSLRDIDQRGPDSPQDPQIESEDQTDQEQHVRTVPYELNAYGYGTVETSGQPDNTRSTTVEMYRQVPNNITPNNKSPDSTVLNADGEISKTSDNDDDSAFVYENTSVVLENEKYKTACDSSHANVYNGNALPSITDVFPKYCASAQTYMLPLFLRIDEEGGSRGQEVEIQQVYDINSNIVDLNSDSLLKLHEASVTSLVAPQSPQTLQLVVRPATSPQGSVPDGTDLETIVSQMNSPWSDMEVGASVTVHAPSPVGCWDDVMNIISQEGVQVYTTDKVDSVQCVCCDWNGASVDLEQHIEQLHHAEVHAYESRLTCTHELSLGALLRERRRAVPVRWHGALFVLLVQYEEPEWIVATVAMLSQHSDSQPIQSTLTVYNKLTGEPFSWSAPVLKSNLIFCGNPSSHLKMQLSRLGLLANSAEVLLWNGQLVTGSSERKIICGDLSLDEINVDFHLELSC